MPERADLAPGVVPELLHGQRCLRLRLDANNSALVALQGAQLLSWQAAGREQLYLSPRARFDGSAAIRGGVPICFPQFNQRGPLPKHGFARNLPWELDAVQVLNLHGAPALRQRLWLHDSESTRALWPHAFALALDITLQAGRLDLTLELENTGSTALTFMAALHGYWAVADVAAASLHGLDGCARWDALTDSHAQQQGAITFAGEYDQVFASGARTLCLHDSARRLSLSHSASFGQTVVWNPGPSLCASLPDMPADGYRHMLCVEAAQIEPALVLAPGGQWRGSQHLALA